MNSLADTLTKAITEGLSCMTGKDEEFTWHVGFLRSKRAFVQGAHVDYSWKDLQINEDKSKRIVPYSAIIPLKENGSMLEVWETADEHSIARESPEASVVIKIGYGSMFMFRGDVVHAGGYKENPACDHLRAHFYIYTREGGQVHATQLTTNKKFPGSHLRIADKCITNRGSN